MDINDLFHEAGLLAGTRASFSFFFDQLTVANATYYGNLFTGREARRWTAAIYLLSGQRHVVGFQGYGETEKAALDDTKGYALKWAAQQEPTP